MVCCTCKTEFAKSRSRSWNACFTMKEEVDELLSLFFCKCLVTYCQRIFSATLLTEPGNINEEKKCEHVLMLDEYICPGDQSF